MRAGLSPTFSLIESSESEGFLEPEGLFVISVLLSLKSSSMADLHDLKVNTVSVNATTASRTYIHLFFESLQKGKKSLSFCDTAFFWCTQGGSCPEIIFCISISPSSALRPSDLPWSLCSAPIWRGWKLRSRRATEGCRSDSFPSK